MTGNSQIKFPQEVNSNVEVASLPFSFDPDIPDQYEYQGHIAERAQNIQYNEKGEVLFFVVDGNIYNGDGLLIADAAEDALDRDCEVCFLGGEQVHIIPVPGSCTRYYVMGLFFNHFQRDASAAEEQAYMRWGVLDMGEHSYLPVYKDACVPVNGRFLDEGELFASPAYGAASASSWHDGWTVIEPGILPDFPSPFIGFALREGKLYEGYYEGTNATLHGSSVQIQPDGRVAMVIRCQLNLLILDVTATDIWKVSSPFWSNGIWPFLVAGGVPGAPADYDIRDKERSQRADMSVHFLNGTLQVAWSSYSWYETTSGQRIHQNRVGRWRFELDPGTPFVVQANVIPSWSSNANPTVYLLDEYADSSIPLDFSGSPIARPAIPGIEFSPNGQYIYFIKSSNYQAVNGNNYASNFGYIDQHWQPGNSDNLINLIPIGTGNESTKLVDSQLDLNTGPDGTGTALYAISSDVDEWWLSAFVDPDVPYFANWVPQVVSLGEVSSFTESDSPNTRFRFLNKRTGRSGSLNVQQDDACCEALSRTRDRSTVIDTQCDMNWRPGVNPFYNETGPIYIAEDSVMRIGYGAHVVAEDMVFKFGKDAVLIIEPGASLTCTNCLFTNACDDSRWKGIEVQGKVWEHQFGSPHPAHQGKLVLLGSTVENAETGVFVAKRGLLGNLAAGGVVLADRVWITEDDGVGGTNSFWQPTTIRNCRESVRFPAYQNFLPGGINTYRNLSSFSDCVFTVDDEYPVAYDFQHHVYMHRVDGIPFRACTFENALPDAFFDAAGDFPGSLYLGHGIRSLDAHYAISSPCDVIVQQGATCAEAYTRFSEFRGLDHGIHALGSAKLRNFSANRVKFTDNIAGVYSSAVVGYSVKNSIFSIGGRNVALTNLPIEQYWDDHHRGIYSHSSYGFAVDDNTLFKTPGSLTDRKTEGVVIGYSRDHNDYVFSNHGENLSVGFAGEGVSASTVPSYGHLIGLQLICNRNTNNDVNLSSRKANGASVNEQDLHTIRTSQGNINRPADNEFDEWHGVPMKWDFEMTTTNGNISYWHRSVSPYVPIGYPPMLNPEAATIIPAKNCATKLPRLIPVPPPGITPAGLVMIIEDEKLAYGTTRYIYDQLIDGGSTDEVVEEITDAWPQEVWVLRNSMLSKSPYLSAEILMELNEQNKLPALLYTEVCIANPEATKSEGFYYWLENKAPHPLAENLLATIAASWEVKTFRSTLESTMADHHESMSQAANMLMEHISSDTTGLDVNALRTVWQEIRTPAARYAEALALLEIGEFEAATTVVAAIPQEHTKLKTRDITEKNRMLSLISFMQNLAVSGRSDAELTPGEQDQLESLIAGQQDRPAVWMQNLLCFHYKRCAALWTGVSGDPKSLPSVKPEEAEVQALLSLYPNPATTWAVVSLELPAGTKQSTLRILDLTGKEVYQQVVALEQPQLVLDTRELAPGAYLVEISGNNGVLATEKLIVQP